MATNGNKILTMVLIGILGVFIGITIVSKQTAHPLMQEMMKQQDKTVSILQRLEGDGGGSGIADLQKRVAALEAKIELLVTAQQNAGGGGGPRPPAPPQEDFTKEYDLSAPHSPVRGNKDAKITIVEFVDFQCPFCARFHPPINEVLAAYPNDVNYVVKNFPLSFHPEAKPGSKAAFAAGEQGKYFEMVDAILKDNSGLSAQKFEELAKEIGLNVEKFKKDLAANDAKYEKWIAADMELAGKSDVRGTPTFFLDKKKTIARSFAQYKAEIDKILAGK